MGQPGVADDDTVAAGRGVPGVGDTVGGWEGYTGYYPPAIPVPTFNHILRLEPYPRPNEGLSEEYDEVSQIWPQNGPRMSSDMASE